MALAAATHWELRGGAGADTNGGAFAGDGSLAKPAAPSLATTTGGTLSVATWYLVITYVYFNGTTSYSGPQSDETSIVVPNATNDAIIVTSPAASTGATHYRVWGSTTSNGPRWPLGSTTGTAIGTDVTITTVVTSGIQAPGVDYSQQNAAQVVIDNSTITTSITTTTVTFTAGYTPTRNDVGNQVQFVSGTNITAGFWQIVGWTATTWVLDRNVPSAGTTTNAVANMGGALNTFGVFQSLVLAANFIYVKAATYSETWTASISGSNRTPINWIGYNATRGDSPTGDNRPLISGGGARTNCLATGSSLVFNIFANFRFASATAACVLTAGNTVLVFRNCKASSAGTIGFSVAAGTGRNLFMIACESASNGTTGFTGNTGVGYYLCYAHDNAGVGFGPDSLAYVMCVSDTNGSTGVETRSCMTFGCTAYGNTGAGFATAGANGAMTTLCNCISSNNSTYGYNDPSTINMYLVECNAFSNTTAAFNQIAPAPFADLDTSDPQFVSAAGGDFRVGLNMKGAALAPGTNVGLAANSVLDLGAVQRAEPGNLRLVNGGLVQ